MDDSISENSRISEEYRPIIFWATRSAALVAIPGAFFPLVDLIFVLLVWFLMGIIIAHRAWKAQEGDGNRLRAIVWKFIIGMVVGLSLYTGGGFFAGRVLVFFTEK